MSQQDINIGAANAKDGDTLHSAFTKIQENTTELFTSASNAMPKAPTTSPHAAQGNQWLNSERLGNERTFGWSSNTLATDPGAGMIKGNNTPLGSITELYISAVTPAPITITSLLKLVRVDDFLTLNNFDNQGNTVFFKVNGAVTDNGVWFTVPVQAEDSVGGFLDASTVTLSYMPTGAATSAQDNLTGGFIVYNDLATASSPISHVGGVDTILTNDGLGPQTLKTFAPTGVTDIWDANNDEFDFSQLANGDMVDIRLNITVVTSSANQEIEIDLMLGVGGFDYLVPFSHDFYKVTGSKSEGGYEGIYIGDDNTRLNGGHFIFKSTNDATITINGWYCKILRRGV